jgi:hypothetical protein
MELSDEWQQWATAVTAIMECRLSLSILVIRR